MFSQPGLWLWLSMVRLRYNLVHVTVKFCTHCVRTKTFSRDSIPFAVWSFCINFVMISSFASVTRVYSFFSFHISILIYNNANLTLKFNGIPGGSMNFLRVWKICIIIKMYWSDNQSECLNDSFIDTLVWFTLIKKVPSISCPSRVSHLSLCIEFGVVPSQSWPFAPAGQTKTEAFPNGQWFQKLTLFRQTTVRFIIHQLKSPYWHCPVLLADKRAERHLLERMAHTTSD